MQHISDALDICVSVIVTALMLFMGVWMWTTLRSYYSTSIVQRTAEVVDMIDLLPERDLTGKEILLSLVVNDTYIPEPGKVVFNADDGSTYTITYDAAWFRDKEASINQAWDEFFINAVNYEHTDWVLHFKSDKTTPDYWEIKMY